MLRVDLRDVVDRDLLGDLSTSYSRQTQFTSSFERGGSRSANTPLPYDDRAGRRAHSLTQLLERWAWTIADAAGITGVYGIDWPRAGAVGAATFLLEHHNWIRTDMRGVVAWRALHAAIDNARRIIDRPVASWFVGPCTARLPDDPDGYCAEDLYATPGATQMTCRRCSQLYDVDDRRTWLLKASEDYLADATFIAQALAGRLDVPVTSQRISQWHSRGRIVPHGWAGRRPLFRIGDILDRLGEDINAQARRTAKRDDAKARSA